MTSFSLQNPGFVTIYDSVAIEPYTFDARGSKRVLTTTRFGREGTEMELLGPEKPASWDVEVPEGAELFGATSGVSPRLAHQLWVGWLVGRKVHMQALMQEGPVDADLASDETPIFPAVMDRSGLAALYSWHPVATGTALLRRVFSGAIKEAATVTGEALSEVPGRPVVSGAIAIPGEESQHAVIGWIEASEAGAVLGVAVVLPDRLRVVRSEPIGGAAPFSRQRIGVWAASPASVGRFSVTALVESRNELSGYRVATLEVAAEQTKPRLTLKEVPVSAKRLRSVAFDYLKDHVDPFCYETYLTIDGTLMKGARGEIKRHHVPLDSSLPVVVTDRAFWGTRGSDEAISFESF